MSWFNKLTGLLGRQRQLDDEALEYLRQQLAEVQSQANELHILNQVLNRLLTTSAQALTDAKTEASNNYRRAAALKRDLENERLFVTKMRQDNRSRFKPSRR